MAVVPLACCAVAGMAMSDYRFLLVGLMLLFVAYPGIMAGGCSRCGNEDQAAGLVVRRVVGSRDLLFL